MTVLVIVPYQLCGANICKWCINYFANQQKIAQKKTYPWFAEIILQNGEWGHLDRATNGASKKGSRATEPEALNAILGKDGLDALAHASVVVLKADSNAGITATLQVTLEQVEGVPKESTQTAAYCTAKQEKNSVGTAPTTRPLTWRKCFWEEWCLPFWFERSHCYQRIGRPQSDSHS